MITLIISLIVTAISGLSFVAYKHPNGYKKIHYVIFSIVSAIVVLVVSYNLGSLLSLIRSLDESLKNYPEHAIKEEAYAISSMNQCVDHILWILAVGFSILGYLIFLYKLPVILNLKIKNEDNKT